MDFAAEQTYHGNGCQEPSNDVLPVLSLDSTSPVHYFGLAWHDGLWSPAAIGAQVAMPDKKVILVDGDGICLPPALTHRM